VISAEHFSSDTLEFLSLLYKNEVKYLIVGGEAVIYYGFARLTGDIDIYYERTQENVARLYRTLLQFWEGDIPGLKNQQELLDPSAVFQFGVPPNRLDLLNEIEGVPFQEAWKYRNNEYISINNENIRIYFICLDHLIRNKQVVARPKDLEDLKYLKALKSKKRKPNKEQN